MRRVASEQASRALLALADLTPAGNDGNRCSAAIPLEWFRWLPLRSVSLFRTAIPRPVQDVERALAHRVLNESMGSVAGAIDRDLGERLAAIDQLRVGDHALRAGWLFVAGRAPTPDGRSTHVFQPLVVRPVRVGSDLGAPHRVLVPAGDLELHPGVHDRETRDRFEEELQVGGGALDLLDETALPPALLTRMPALRRYAKDLALAAGFRVSAVISAAAAPEDLLHADHLVVVVGAGVYTARPTDGTTSAVSMAGWVSDGLTDTWTSFHTLYVDAEPPPARAPGRPEEELTTLGTKPVSPFPLTPAQRKAVVESRTAPVAVIAGAPGTGKSHTIAAIACDAISRGRTVLVAAKSDATIDALVSLFEQAPGPQPVVFGSNERKDALAARLAGGNTQEVREADVDRRREVLAATVTARDALYAHVASRLRAASALDPDGERVTVARVTHPQLFDPSADLHRIGQLIAVASHGGGGWLSARRQRHATEELDELSGARSDGERSAFVDAYCLARDARSASELVVDGGLDLHDEWPALLHLEEQVREDAARWLSADVRSPERFDRATLFAIGALATALRSGRAVRRERLRHLDGTITRALPLWVGTLADIEDLLPRAPGLFDLLVLDEASSIDQPLAAPALLRSRRVVVVGDPRQLRHVSFLADDQRDAALAANGVAVGSPLAAKLDVRRNSAFDLAAASVSVRALDEHFRCAPHLVDFVARRLYDGQLKIATRSPATECVDCVDIVRVEGRRDGGVVRAEVDEVIRQLHDLRSRGTSSIGVITPFRAQADAIEAAVLSAFDHDAVVGMGLRIGTVHAFQGNERDTVLISLGVGEGGTAGAWRFAQDPHLFTVLVTRARRRLVLITAGDPPAGGLLAEYLAEQDSPPGPPTPVPVDVPWVDSLVRDLRATSVPAFAGYPTGRHVVDICVGTAQSFFGIEAMVHPDGADAHIDRHLSLLRAGWVLKEAHPSRWGDRRGELVVDLVQALRSPPASVEGSADPAEQSASPR